MLPVYIRLHYGTASEPVDANDLRQQVLDAVREQARVRDVEVPPPAPSRTLWEFFRRRDQAFWGPGTTLVVPLLVFDQFEQLFTRDTARLPSPGIDEFLLDLSDLASGRMPAWVADDVGTRSRDGDSSSNRPAARCSSASAKTIWPMSSVWIG